MTLHTYKAASIIHVDFCNRISQHPMSASACHLYHLSGSSSITFICLFYGVLLHTPAGPCRQGCFHGSR